MNGKKSTPNADILEKRYYDALELIPDGLIVIDITGKVKQCNQSFLKLSGFDRSEIVGKHIQDMPTLKKQNIPKYLKLFSSLIKGKAENQIEFEWVRKDGAERIGEVHYKLRKEPGKIPELFCLVRDITDEKMAEIALMESEEKYKKIVEIARDAVVIHCNGIVQYANPAALRLFGGKNGTDLIGKSALDFVHPDFRAATIKRMSDLLHGKKVQYPVECVYLKADGSPALVELSASKVTYNNKPAIQKFIRDITEQRKQLEALQSSEQKWRELFENLRDGWFSTNLEGHFKECNNAYEKLLGYSLQELKEKSFFEITPVKWHEYEKQIVNEQIIKKGYSGVYEKEYIRKDGKVIPVEMSCYLQRDNSGTTIGMWGMARDISARKAAQDMATVSEYLYRLTLANISDTVFVTDENGDFTFVCPGTETIFGYDKDEVINIGNVKKLLGKSLIDVREIRNRGEIINIEHRITDKTGQFHDLLVSIKAAAIGQGSILYTCHDITERKRIENLWKLNREILEKVTRGASLDSVFDDITGRVDELLPGTFSSIFLMLPDQKHIHLVSGSQLSETWQKRRNILAIGEKYYPFGTVAFTGQRIISDDIATDPHWDEELRQDALNIGLRAYWSQPVLSSQDNRVLGVFSLCSQHKRKPDDFELQLMETLAELITLILERKHNEERVLSERERLFLLLDMLPGTIYLLSADHRIKFANGRFIEEYGADFSKPCYELIHGKSQPCDDCPTFEVFKTKRPKEYEWTMPDGKVYLTYDLPFSDTDGSPMVLEYSLDISDRVSMEKSLRASEKQFRLIWEKSPLGLRLTDADGQIVRVNDAYCKMVNMTTDELIGQPFVKTYIPSEQNIGIEKYRKYFKNRTVSDQYEAELHFHDGRSRWIMVSNSFLEYGHLKEPHLLSIFQEVTERKHAEEQLKKSERILRQVIDLVPHFIFAKDKDGKFILANKAVAEAYGTTTENLIAKSDYDFNPNEEEVKHFIEDDRKVIDSGEELFSEEVITDSKGVTRYLETNKIPFTASGSGKAAVLGVSVDVTERRKAEQELRISEARYRSVYQTAPLAFAVWTPDTKLMDWNDEAEHIFGWKKDQVIGKSFFDVIIPDIAEKQVKDIVANILSGKAEKQVVHQNKTKDGHIIWCQWSNAAVTDTDGNVKYVISLGLDITEKKKDEEQLRRKMAEIERFNKFMVGRENRMIELKQEINELCEKLGIPTRYKSSK